MLLVIIFGLVFGSFLAAVSYRLPRGISIARGRSFCDHCRKPIAWWDNLPVVSYFFLKGKCRHCKKSISLRYPLIELATTLLFVGVFFSLHSCPARFSSALICDWFNRLGFWVIPYFLIILTAALAILVIDLEQMIIPDELVFGGFLTTLITLLLAKPELFYPHLLSGFVSALFLLLLHLITKGKGMGLGDVKLALFLGTFLGWPLGVAWLFLSFLTGAAVGLILILSGRAVFKDKIAFGPYLVFSFMLVLFLGSYLL